MAAQQRPQALEHLYTLPSYCPGKPITELQRELGRKDVIKLASNENPLGASPLVLAALQDAMRDMSRYPDSAAFSLRQSLAKHLSVPMECITVGNGSNEILDLLIRAYVCPRQEILFSQYAFIAYALLAKAANAHAVAVKARDWGHDLAAMQARITPATKIIFIANPNNPTGTLLTHQALTEFIQAVPEDVLIVIDEAYHEYVDDPAYQSLVSFVAHYPNLVVVRTFSKAYGLAGLRVGFAVAAPLVSDILQRLRMPFNVNHLGLVAAEAALGDAVHLQNSITQNAAGRRFLTGQLTALEFSVVPSQGNFVLFDVGQEANPIYTALLKKGVIVRPLLNYGLPNHLRVSVGLPHENQRFITALQQVMAHEVAPA